VFNFRVAQCRRRRLGVCANSENGQAVKSKNGVHALSSVFNNKTPACTKTFEGSVKSGSRRKLRAAAPREALIKQPNWITRSILCRCHIMLSMIINRPPCDLLGSPRVTPATNWRKEQKLTVGKCRWARNQIIDPWLIRLPLAAIGRGIISQAPVVISDRLCMHHKFLLPPNFWTVILICW